MLAARPVFLTKISMNVTGVEPAFLNPCGVFDLKKDVSVRALRFLSLLSPRVRRRSPQDS